MECSSTPTGGFLQAGKKLLEHWSTKEQMQELIRMREHHVPPEKMSNPRRPTRRTCGELLRMWKGYSAANAELASSPFGDHVYVWLGPGDWHLGFSSKDPLLVTAVGELER